MQQLLRTALLAVVLHTALLGSSLLTLTNFLNGPGAHVGAIEGDLDSNPNLFVCVTYDRLTTPPTAFSVSLRSVSTTAERAQALLIQAMLAGLPEEAPDYQYAIWSLTGFGVPVFGNSSALAAQAMMLAGVVPPGNFAGWFIADPLSTKDQSFMFYDPVSRLSNVPEAPSSTVALAGLAVLLVSRKRPGSDHYFRLPGQLQGI